LRLVPAKASVHVLVIDRIDEAAVALHYKLKSVVACFQQFIAF
jgi:hypothetical protein